MDARRAGETIRDDGRGRRDAGEQWRDAPARRAAASRPMVRDRRRATVAARSRPAAAGAAARGTAAAGPVCDTRVRRAHSRSHARPRAGRAGRASRGDGRRDRAGSRCGAVERVREDGRRRRAVLADRRKRRGRAARLTHTHAKTGRSRSRPRRRARPAAGRATQAGSGWGNAAAHARCARRRAAPRATATRRNTAAGRRNRGRPGTTAPHRMRRARRQARPATRRRRRANLPDSPSSFVPVSAPGSPSRTYSIQREPVERASIRDAAFRARRCRYRPLTPPPGLVSVAFNRPGICSESFKRWDVAQPIRSKGRAILRRAPSGKVRLRFSRDPGYTVDRFLIHRRISRVRGPRNVRCRSCHRHHAFAAPCAQCRNGSARACMRLTGCRRETAAERAPNARFMDATFRSGRTSPVPAWGKSPCARNGRRCLRCRVSRTAEAAVVPTLDHPAFVSGHAPIAASRLPGARCASYHVCNVPSCRRDGRTRRTTRPPDAERLV
ncbi:hypothetical protein KY49_5414 [Burkholderia sp. MSHR3999]|nr:hypothetical protein KY49_5414 [Burkholderia sp. MSHR3999]